MNRKIKKKKIPILSYLCYLLVVSVLFTGVTFSRYSTATSGDLGANVSPFIASYRIDNLSSNTYTNANFWLENNTQQGVSRYVRFTVANHRPASEAAGATELTSDVDLSSKIRFYLPAEFADNLAIQLLGEGGNAVMPQIVLGNLIYNVEYKEHFNSEGNSLGSYYGYTNDTKTYASHGENATLETGKFRDYAAAACTDATLTMSGGLSESGGTVTAKWGGADSTTNTLTITASKAMQTYSVGFRRVEGAGDDKNENAIMPQLFLDLEKEMTFYTVELDIPTVMQLTGGTQQEHTFDLYLALTDNIQSGDLNFNWTTAHDSLLTNGGSFNGATVTGYHFDYDAAIYKKVDGTWQKSGTTQIRVQKTFARDKEPEKLTFHHVAPISETTVSYVHPISDFYTLDENELNFDTATAPAVIADAQELFGLCSQFQATRDQNEVPEYYISFANVPDDPFYLDYEGQTGATGETEQTGQTPSKQTTILMSLSKSFYTSLTVVFTQTSLPRPQGGAEGGSV